MTIPDYQSLMLPVLAIAAEGETRVPAAAEKIADKLGLSSVERDELLPSGKQRLLHNRVHWAKFYMSKAGLITSPRRGVFVATEAGLALLKQNRTKIDVETLKGYALFSEFYSRAGTAEEPDQIAAITGAATSGATPEEQIDAASNLLAAALKADLLARIVEQTPTFRTPDRRTACGYGLWWFARRCSPPARQER